jgi:hypothetical protein
MELCANDDLLNFPISMQSAYAPMQPTGSRACTRIQNQNCLFAFRLRESESHVDILRESESHVARLRESESHVARLRESESHVARVRISCCYTSKARHA